MAGAITHRWDGTTLIVTSDSGTSACDLKGDKGDMGVRGVQGAAGVLTDPTGTIIADANKYYQKEEVDDAIGAAKVEAFTKTNNLADDLNLDILDINNAIDTQNKRITNLEHSLAPTNFETDTSAAYSKDVPEGALPYAEINRVGGMSRKCKNLFDINNRLTGSINTNGDLEIEGGTRDFYNYGFKTNTQYTLSGYIRNYNTTGSVRFRVVYTDGSSDINALLNTTTEFAYITFTTQAGKTISKITIWYGDVGYMYIKGGELMLNEGSTALPYEPYYNELRDTKVTEIKSRIGANLFDVKKILSGSRTNTNGNVVSISPYATSDYIEVDGNAYYYFTNVCGDAYCSIVEFTENKEVIRDRTIGEGTVVSGSIKVSSNARYVRVNIYSATVDVNTVMVHKGATALPYEPYKEDIKAIPAEVQALDGYGLGINENLYNYLEWQPEDYVKTWHKNVGVVDMGTLNWARDVDYGNYYYATISGKKQDVSNNLLCSIYEPTEDYGNNAADMTIRGSAGREMVFVRNNAYTDAASFKAAMSGVMLVYELATPEVTDISELLPDDNFIRVEEGGTIYAENSYRYGAPTHITYQFKGVSA